MKKEKEMDKFFKKERKKDFLKLFKEKSKGKCI